MKLLIDFEQKTISVVGGECTIRQLFDFIDSLKTFDPNITTSWKIIYDEPTEDLKLVYQNETNLTGNDAYLKRDKTIHYTEEIAKKWNEPPYDITCRTGSVPDYVLRDKNTSV